MIYYLINKNQTIIQNPQLLEVLKKKKTETKKIIREKKPQFSI